MAEFMVLLRNARNPLEGMSDEDKAASMSRWMEWVGKMKSEGRMVSGSGFGMGARVVHEGGKITQEPHPATDGKTLRGYFVFNGESLDDVAAIFDGSELTTDGSCVEIHPISGM